MDKNIELEKTIAENVVKKPNFFKDLTYKISVDVGILLVFYYIFTRFVA